MRAGKSESNIAGNDFNDPSVLLRELQKYSAHQERKAQARRDNPMLTYGVGDIHDVAQAVVGLGLSGRSLLPDHEEVEAAVRDGTIFQKFVSNIHGNDAEAEFGALLFDLFKTYQAANRLHSGKATMRPHCEGKKTPEQFLKELGCPAEAAIAWGEQYRSRKIVEGLQDERVTFFDLLHLIADQKEIIERGTRIIDGADAQAKLRKIFDLDDDIPNGGPKNDAPFVEADRVHTVEAARRSVASETGQSMRSLIRATKGWSVEQILALVA